MARGIPDAAERLAADGIDAEVVDLRTLVPLDMATVINSVEKTGRAVVTHYAAEFAGPGAEIAAQINANLFGRLHGPVQRVAARYRPIPSAKILEPHMYPSAGRIADAALATMATAR